jgi:hypothetical protein
MSQGLAAKCCDEFAAIMKLLFDKEYLRFPDTSDLTRIIILHKERHQVNGMFGSIGLYAYWMEKLPKSMASILQDRKGEWWTNSRA